MRYVVYIVPNNGQKSYFILMYLIYITVSELTVPRLQICLDFVERDLGILWKLTAL